MNTQLETETRLGKVDFQALKSGGFIRQTQKDLFTVRLRCPAGKVTSEQMAKAAAIADKYGRGEVHVSVRQSIEIPYVHLQHFDEVSAELKEVEWSPASCGPRVRVPTACAGCTYNPNGLTDTQGMCREVDGRYFGVSTGHHKFKMSFSGCPIDCTRTRGQDLGFQGIARPELVSELCDGCGLCATGCDEGALTLTNGLPVRDDSKCNYCGDCTKICPVDAMVVANLGWLVRVGGNGGKHAMHAYEVAQFVSDEQCLPLIEKTLEWYKANASGRERIGRVISRVGLATYVDEVVRQLVSEPIATLEERRKFGAGGNLGG